MPGGELALRLDEGGVPGHSRSPGVSHCSVGAGTVLVWGLCFSLPQNCNYSIFSSSGEGNLSLLEITSCSPERHSGVWGKWLKTWLWSPGQGGEGLHPHGSLAAIPVTGTRQRAPSLQPARRAFCAKPPVNGTWHFKRLRLLPHRGGGEPRPFLYVFCFWEEVEPRPCSPTAPVAPRTPVSPPRAGEGGERAASGMGEDPRIWLQGEDPQPLKGFVGESSTWWGTRGGARSRWREALSGDQGVREDEPEARRGRRGRSGGGGRGVPGQRGDPALQDAGGGKPERGCAWRGQPQTTGQGDGGSEGRQKLSLGHPVAVGGCRGRATGRGHTCVSPPPRSRAAPAVPAPAAASPRRSPPPARKCTFFPQRSGESGPAELPAPASGSARAGGRGQTGEDPVVVQPREMRHG